MIENEVDLNEMVTEGFRPGNDLQLEEIPVLDHSQAVIGIRPLEEEPDDIWGDNSDNFLYVPFTEYSVSEGLLTLIFVILFFQFILNLIRRFS